MRKQSFILLFLAVVSLTAGWLLRSRFSGQFSTTLQQQIETGIRLEYQTIDMEAASLLLDSLAVGSSQWDQATRTFISVNPSGAVAWNHNQYIPDPSAWQGPGVVSFISNQRGDFLIKKWPWKDGYLVNILTLRDRYLITNGFLFPQLNPAIFPLRELDIVGPAGSVGNGIMLGDQLLFRVVAGPVELRDSFWSFAAFLLGITLLMLALRGIFHGLQRYIDPDFLLLALLGALYGVRLGMVRTGIPSVFLGSDIFDPKVFASSELNASMGDLLFNGLSVFVVVLYLLRHFSGMRSVRWLLQQHSVIRFIGGIFCLLLAFFAVMFSFNFIEVIYHNSAQTLDITQSLTFSWVRTTAFLAVLVGTISVFLFIHIMVSLARHMLADRLTLFFVALFVAAGLFVVQYTVSGNDNHISLATGLVFLPLLRVLNFDKLEFAFSFRFFVYLVFALTIFSVHHSLAIRAFHQERLIRDQYRYAKDFLTERDVLGEYLLDQARHRIAEDPFIRTRMASPFFSKNSIVDKIRRVHVNRYFDRYELEISTRSSMDTAAVSGRAPAGFQPTGYSGIWYSGTTAGEALKQYRVLVPVVHQRMVGFVELDLVLKRVLPDNVFPELLVDSRFSQMYKNRDFSYAIFREEGMVNSFGAYNYEKDFEESLLKRHELYQSGLNDHGYVHIGIEEADGSVAVVSAPDYFWSSFVTNVSFWFVVGLTLLLLVQGIFGAVALLTGRRFAYTARIQLFMFLAFALPMVAVSITTLTLMARSSEEGTTREFLDRSISASQRVATLFSSDEVLDDTRLEAWVSENAVYAKADISVYDPSGKLLATSQPSLFENQLVSTKMNREALRRIVLDGERQVVTSEQIGTLQYNNAYAAVLSPQTGKLTAVVSLPFFESASTLQKSQLLILSNILKVFVVVFLVFTLLSFLAADSLAFPIKFIAKKLRQTTFTDENKPLAWSARDEIGMLVAEYNRMVQNLEESKRALARSEKESAWREMAKQVAHEIKNPLTPMKLTLQQMEQGLLSGNMNLEKSRKSVDVLLRQVEILNGIASSFSTFARMPAPAPQRLELMGILTETTNLFGTGDNAQVSLQFPAEVFWVSVDPTSFSRAVSNVLINALQAGVEGRKLTVSMSVVRQEDKVITSIRDDGRGMTPEVQGRIFQPQFTTKESGSGLGLAMAQQIIVQAGGRIWFESVDGKGTTFYIELPLVS